MFGHSAFSELPVSSSTALVYDASKKVLGLKVNEQETHTIGAIKRNKKVSTSIASVETVLNYWNLLNYTEDLRATGEAGEDRPWGQSDFFGNTVNTLVAPGVGPFGNTDLITKLGVYRIDTPPEYVEFFGPYQYGGSTKTRFFQAAEDPYYVPDDNTDYCLSIYAKAEEIKGLKLEAYGKDSSTSYVTFNLLTGVVSSVITYSQIPTEYGIIDAGNGWYRCWLVYNSHSSFHPCKIGAGFCNADGTSIDPAALNLQPNDGFYLFGAQFTKGTQLLPYKAMKSKVEYSLDRNRGEAFEIVETFNYDFDLDLDRGPPIESEVHTQVATDKREWSAKGFWLRPKVKEEEELVEIVEKLEKVKKPVKDSWTVLDLRSNKSETGQTVTTANSSTSILLTLGDFKGLIPEDVIASAEDVALEASKKLFEAILSYKISLLMVADFSIDMKAIINEAVTSMPKAPVKVVAKPTVEQQRQKLIQNYIWLNRKVLASKKKKK